jgi:uncharacterized protein YjiS (DUF1127 family)
MSYIEAIGQREQWRPIMKMDRIRSSRPSASFEADFRDVGVLGQAAVAREIPVLGAANLILAAFELVSEGFTALSDAVRGHLARQRVKAQLRALDDRLLGDIGLSRDQIDAAAAGRLVVEGRSALAPRANDNLARPANDQGPRAAA